MEKKTLEQIGEEFNKIEQYAHVEHALPLYYGRFFSEARKNNWFELMDTTFESFAGELRKTPKTIYGYENTYKTWCEVAGYSIEDLSFPKNLTRLNKLKKYFFDKDENGDTVLFGDKSQLDEWLAKAITLSTTDFNTEFKKEFKLKKIGEHKHNWDKVQTKEVYACDVCDEKLFHKPEENNE